MAQPLQTRCFKEALARVQDLFVDTPGVKLTTADAAQMAGLDRQVCRVLLRTLIDTGFLEQRVRGMFVRRIPTHRNRGEGCMVNKKMPVTSRAAQRTAKTDVVTRVLAEAMSRLHPSQIHKSPPTRRAFCCGSSIDGRLHRSSDT